MAPAPQPVEGSMAVARFLGQPQEGVPRPNTISLGTLIDFIVQRTYHDLTVLSELLPRKSDMERKIEIYNFAARTRQLFIRLIAVVKWANSVSKVEKSANIMSFLDQQNMLFIDTADKLARMSRETLVHARLPVYQIPAAVEVLTRGTYNRLPKCIRDRVVPPDPITTAEKRQTLLRLNQVIQHRLVTCNLVPQMKNLKIKDGRVTFEVKNEFTLSLTVMGDEPELPWHLLGLEILVEDKETGDGKPMVHPLQVQFLHDFVQRRLVQVANPLGHVYDCLHFFCQSLQLEVLYTQALRLSFERLDENIFVEEYAPGARITVSYWRKLTSRDKGELAYRLTVQAEGSQACNQLVVVHVPSLGAKETAEVAERALRSDHLSIERLIVHAIHLRSIMRLTDVKHELQPYLKDVDFNLQGTPAILTVPVLTPCLRAEQIHITVDTYTGLLRCHVPKHVDCPIMPEMQAILNGDRSKLLKCLTELRYWITHRRCEKTLQHLPATACESLPFLTAPDNAIVRQGRQKVFVRLHRYPNVILVVQLREKEGVVNEMDYTFHLGFVAYLADEKDNSDEELLGKGHLVPATINTTNRGVMNSGVGGIGVSAEMPKPFMKLLKLFELDTFLLMHGPVTDVDEVPPHKRKPFVIEGVANGAGGAVVPASGNAPSTKQQKTIYPAYFIPELAHFVAMCDEIVPFMALGQALVRHNIPHSGIQVEPNATSLVLRILTLPKPDAAVQQAMAAQVPFAAPNQPQQGAQHGGHKHLPPITDQMWQNLMKRVLSISIRSQVLKNNQVRNWGVEFVFCGTPLASSHPNEQGQRRTLHLPYDQVSHDFDKTVKELLVDWSRIVYLYALVYQFAEHMRNERLNLSDIVAITSFNYMNLQFGYGPKKEMSCNIDWCTQTSAYRLNFFGSISSANSHSIMRDQLLTHLNRNFNLTHIVQILHDTYQPLSSIAKLPVIPLLGIPKTQVPVLSFCILPQSPCIVRLLYQGLYCLEVRFRTNRLVSVRDGAYSHFDRHLIGEITPIQGLKSFLSKYVDENAVYRGRSQSEDDNPPSPLGIEDSYGGPGSVTGAGAGGSSPFLSSGMRGPQSPRDSGLRFPAPHTPPSSSNPHTPSSPHPGAGGAGGPNHPNYNLTSPPAPHMPHPSPGGLMPSSPLNPQPSPHMVHSPGPSTLYMQGHQDSPFSAMSPANTNWPGSPSMPRPSPRPGQSPEHKPSGLASGGSGAASMMSRVAPNRSWAGSVPTLLTHEALETLCRSSAHPNKDFQSAIEISAIERFLGCVYMRRHLHRSVQADDSLMVLNSAEPGVLLFKVDGLQCQVMLNPNHMQSLHLKVTQPPLPPTPDGKQPFQLAPDDLLVIEQFFETRVAVPPYRPNSMNGFCRALSCGPQVLKDFVQIMRLEMKPELGGDQLKWTVQFCMRVPPSAAPIVPIGSPGLIIYRQKILFFLQITRIPYNGVEWKDSPSLILPVVYDMSTNVTQLADRREQTSQAITLASTLMRRFSEYNVQHGQCTLFPAVRDLLTNLQLPNDIPPPNQVQGMGQVMGQSGMGPGGMGQPMGPAMGQGMPMNQPMGQPGMGPGGGMGQPMPMNQNMGPQAMGQYIGSGVGIGGVGNVGGGMGGMGSAGVGNIGGMGGGMGGIGGMGGPVGQVGPIGQMGPVGAVNPIGPVLGSSPNPMMPQINQVGAPSVGQINQYPQMGQNPGSGPV